MRVERETFYSRIIFIAVNLVHWCNFNVPCDQPANYQHQNDWHVNCMPTLLDLIFSNIRIEYFSLDLQITKLLWHYKPKIYVLFFEASAGTSTQQRH